MDTGFESNQQTFEAAGRVLTHPSHDRDLSAGPECAVAESQCISCGACISVCSYGAIKFHETPRGRKVSVDPDLCKGDGLCSAKCPTGAIMLKHYADEEIFSQIDAAFPDEQSDEEIFSQIDTAFPKVEAVEIPVAVPKMECA